MLLATTILLLVFRLPSAIISVMWLISAKMFINEKPPFPLRRFHSIANLCATLNAATTFIMFIIYGTKFRSEFTSIYCCCLDKFRTKKEIIENKQEQQIKQLIPDDNDINEQHIDDQLNPLSTNSFSQKLHRATARHSSSATNSTTTTSIASLPSLRRLRNQRRNPRYLLERERDLITHSTNLQQQHELTIQEDECNIQNNDIKLDRLSVSYGDCFISLINCR